MHVYIWLYIQGCMWLAGPVKSTMCYTMYISYNLVNIFKTLVGGMLEFDWQLSWTLNQLDPKLCFLDPKICGNLKQVIVY